MIYFTIAGVCCRGKFKNHENGREQFSHGNGTKLSSLWELGAADHIWKHAERNGIYPHTHTEPRYEFYGGNRMMRESLVIIWYIPGRQVSFWQGSTSDESASCSNISSILFTTCLYTVDDRGTGRTHVYDCIHVLSHSRLKSSTKMDDFPERSG